MAMPPPSLQQPRRRRQHKRSRNGCYTCKQRHTRCDEKQPICTNCLVRGGDCGYPNENGDLLTPDSKGEASGYASDTPAADPVSLSTGFNLDLDPDLTHLDSGWTALDNLDFDASAFVDGTPFMHADKGKGHADVNAPTTPQAMLAEHLTQFRMLTHSLTPHPIDVDSESPHTQHSCLLLSAMHYAWVHGSLGDAEHTFLYHKGEAIRNINLHISDPDPVASNLCTTLMAALALAETGIGDVEAAQAHLNGLVTLIQWRQPDDWMEQLNHLFHSVVFVYIEYLRAAE